MEGNTRISNLSYGSWTNAFMNAVEEALIGSVT